jgi:hypothetical protein
MAIILDHAPINIASGFFQTAGIAIAANVTTLQLRLARNTTATPTFWPNASTTIVGNIRVSFDGGSNYQHSCGFTASGGLVIVDGVEASETTLRGPVTPTQSGRLIRADVTVTNGPLLSELTLETFTT